LIVLDTSALIYWSLDPNKLTNSAVQAIKDADKISISSISVWEIGLKVKKGHLTIPLPIVDFANKLEKVERLEILPVDVAIWLENLSLKWKHLDPADRTIVATARIHDCSLVTSDRVIRRFYKKSIW
jgi:PIN domain nuclease of toxin-antitoxin system